MKKVYILLFIFFIAACKKDNDITDIADTDSSVYPNPQHKKVLMCQGKPWELTQANQWKKVSKNLDYFKFYIDQIDDNRYSLQEKQAFITVLNTNKIEIAVEMGGLLAHQSVHDTLTADFSFMQEYQKIQSLIKPSDIGGYNGNVDVIDMDGSLRRVLFENQNGNNLTEQKAINEFMDVILLWQNKFPNVKINYLVNFPNWGWKGDFAYFNLVNAKGDKGYGDFYDMLNKVFVAAQNRGVQINGLTVDCPYDYVLGIAKSNQASKIQTINWFQRLLELENMVKSHGWEFNLIFNSQKAGEKSRGSNKDFSDNVMNYLNDYLNLSGNPDGYWVQSWYYYPNVFIPEDSLYTMTHLSHKVIKRVKN